MMPVSSNTVDTQIEFEPDIGGVSSGSMMIQPIAASGIYRRDQQVYVANTPPRGSLRTKLRSGLILRDPLRLLPDGLPRRRIDAADDDVANFAFCVAAHYLDGTPQSDGHAVVSGISGVALGPNGSSIEWLGFVNHRGPSSVI